MNQNPSIVTSPASGVTVNKVVRNTYMLLSMTLLFSAAAAGLAIATNAQPVNFLVMLAVFWGGPMIIHRFARSAWSLPMVFAFTGAMGYILGPIISFYLAMPNGGEVVASALGATGLMFLALSGYALVSRRDFNFMGGFLMVGLLVVLVAIVANIFLHIPALSLAISAMAVMLMSGLILFDTSRMVHGGETNYVIMTVSLYSNIYVLFLHLLNLFSAFSGKD